MSQPDTSADRVPDLGPDRTPYALGFALDDRGRVALIRKSRPHWQAGLLNGLGGHVEPGETPVEAMRREFWEEAGLRLDAWDHIATVEFETGAVWVFRTFIPADVLDRVRTCTDEPVVLVEAGALPAGVIPNLRWLVPLANYAHDTYDPLVAREQTS